MNLDFNAARHLTAVVLLLSANVAAESAPTTDLSTALTAANDNGKPIFVYVFDSV